MNTDYIDGIIKIFITNIFIYTVFFRINNEEKSKIKIIIESFLASVLYICTKQYLNDNIFLKVLLSYIGQTIIQKCFQRDKKKSIIVSNLLANALVYTLYCISLFIELLPKILLNTKYQTIDLIITLLIETVMLTVIFRTRRVRYGVEF